MAIAVLSVLIVVICLGWLRAAGLWRNALRLVNLVAAALLAMNFFEPAAAYLETLHPALVRYADFAALWGLLALFFFPMQGLTRLISPGGVRFATIVDLTGGWLFSAVLGWTLACFALTTLHTLPLGHNALAAMLQPQQAVGGDYAPDRCWLDFVRRMSAGALCRTASEELRRTERYVFVARDEFAKRYAARRAVLDGQPPGPSSTLAP